MSVYSYPSMPFIGTSFVSIDVADGLAIATAMRHGDGVLRLFRFTLRPEEGRTEQVLVHSSVVGTGKRQETPQTEVSRVVIPGTVNMGATFPSMAYFPRTPTAPDLNGDGVSELVMAFGAIASDGDEKVGIISYPFGGSDPTIEYLSVGSALTHLGFATAMVAGGGGGGRDTVVLGMPKRPHGNVSAIGGVGVVSSGPDNVESLVDFTPDTVADGVGADVAVCGISSAGMATSRIVLGAPGPLDGSNPSSRGAILTFDQGATLRFAPLMRPWSDDLSLFGRYVSCGSDSHGLSVLAATGVWASGSVDGQQGDEVVSVYVNPRADATPSFIVDSADLLHPTTSSLGRTVVAADLTGDGHADLLTTYITSNDMFGLLVEGPLNRPSGAV